MNSHIRMGPGREFDTIRSLIEQWGPLAAGIGDDAALLHVADGRTLVASTDAFVENAHFREGWLTPQEVGARATAAALSDLAAMGARADAILLAFVVPEMWRDRLPGVADGIGRVVASAGARIAGGNISGGSSFSITTTVIGSALRVIPRSGARPGDVLLVTGALGGPGQALRAWNAGAVPSAWARDRFAAPVARLAVGEAIAAAGAHAMLDISDGVAADARHMAAASGVALRIDASLLPRGPDVSVADALTSGEEYELLVACPRVVADEIVSRIPLRYGLALTIVGDVILPVDSEGASGRMASGGVVIDGVENSGSAHVHTASGHDHFSS